MYLLDTSVCVDLLDALPSITKKFSELGDTEIATCIIVQGELLYGARMSELTDENLEKIEKFLQDIQIYNLNQTTSDIYAETKTQITKRFGPQQKKERRKLKIESLGFGENDLWIASIAIQHGLTVISSDNHFQRMSGVNGLKVEIW